MVLRFNRKARIVKVSIVTATYNSARTLGDTMKSVLKQTYPDIEYIVVDGSSTDNTKDVIRQYEPQFSGRLKWVSEKDGGIYDAMNKGIRTQTLMQYMVTYISYTTANQTKSCAITVQSPSVRCGSVLDLCLPIRRSIAVAASMRKQGSTRPTMLSVQTMK